VRDLGQLRRALTSWWRFTFYGWKERKTISELCDAFDALPTQEKELHERLTKLNGDLTAAQHARELAEKEAEAVKGIAAGTQTELKELHAKYADLLRRKEAPEERAARDALYLAKLEIEDFKSRLELERKDHEKSKRHITTMWNFIAQRHRIDLPAENGSIRKILQKAETRR